MRREYTSAVGEYRTVSGKITGPWRRGMCPRRRWREKCARARSRHRPRPRAVECRGYSKELWSQQKAYLPPAPCISRLARNARKNGMFSRPRICLTRISRIDRMGQQLAPTLNCAFLDWFTRLKSGSIYSLDGNIRHDPFSLYFCRNIAPGEPFSLGVYALHSIGKHGQDSGRRDPRVHHQPRQGGPRTDLQEEGSSCGASGACHPKKPCLSRD